MTTTRVMLVYRLAFAVLVLVAQIAQFGVSIRLDLGVVNFFSYFTNLGNLIAVVVFIVGAVRLARGVPDSRTWALVRFCSVVNMVFVGLVFNTLLAGFDLGPLYPWVNVVLHMLMPVAVLVDWLVLAPRVRLGWRDAWIALVFPVVYSVYSLIRGAIVDWYPYPFYDADKVGGVGGLVLYLLALIVALAVLALVLLGIGRALRRGSDRQPA
ncbi:MULTISPECIES: Pr6Pr family membrane protein [unclassified Curtobacterium]|uniref:Pr6Pr family membrane protein n=1 Tax=unclassified Curtobacterium TaxID=257496 RepID=UPI000F4ACBDA|nr:MULTISPECIES: Pr6Pr family membrane protein [unclassified Curtobacterium]ROS37267.1 hypothetical protein EDF53_1508 [Curtobacterium sp. PhB78]